MNILIVHGHFLDGNGSNIYACNLAKEIKKNGHRVIILSQENQVKDYSLVDRVYEFSFGNKSKRMTYKSSTNFRGECILIKPEIQGILPVYYKEKIDGYETKEIHKMKKNEIQKYITIIANAIDHILNEIKIDLVISTHLFPEPFAIESLKGKYPGLKHYCIVDGNCFYYSYLKNKSLQDFIIPVFKNVDSIFFLNKEILSDIIKEFSSCAKIIREKGSYVPPGVDTDVFKLQSGDIEKKRAYENLNYKLENEGKECGFLQNFTWDKNLNIITYGQFTLEKGILLLLLVFPFIKKSFPEANLYIVGDGKSRAKYEQVLTCLSKGNKEEFYEILNVVVEEFNDQNGKNNLYEVCYFNIIDTNFAEEYFLAAENIEENVFFTGYLDHSKLADLISLMDISVFPVVSKEGYSISVLESMSTGVPVIVPGNTGMSEIENTLRNIYIDEFNIEGYKEIAHNEEFLDNLILNIMSLLNFIKNNEKKGKAEELKRRISSEISKKYSWFYVYENIISKSRQRS